MKIKQILPAPKNWVVFHYANHPGNVVTPWHWEPLAYMALCVDDEGEEVALPMINREYGLSVPPPNVEVCVSHPAAAREWLYDDTDIVEKEALERYLEAVIP
jgi:hypothetical protein